MTAGTLVAVFVGGGTGAVCRYVVARFVGDHYVGTFPLGTVVINVSGCFALGFLASVLAVHTGTARLTALLATGFLGGYTTFSSYALESARLRDDGEHMQAWSNLIGSIVSGLIAAALGAGAAHLL